jgi:endonuclease-3 related protein
MNKDERIFEVYETLADFFPDLGWWPGTTDIEKIVGMILVQNTSFKNVERALANLSGHMSVQAILQMPEDELKVRIRPSGYFNMKAKKLYIFMEWLESKGGIQALKKNRDVADMRRQLLAIYGIGEETADSILLYILDQKMFISDAYARRIFNRYFNWDIKSYQAMADTVGQRYAEKLTLAQLQQFHGMIDETGKEYCTKNNPHCRACPLHARCLFASRSVSESGLH